MIICEIFQVKHKAYHQIPTYSEFGYLNLIYALRDGNKSPLQFYVYRIIFVSISS